jgi:centromeric protein E
MSDNQQSFDLERTIASLRRQLASKETELETLNDELTSALGRLGDLHEINLRIVSLESDIDMLQTDHAALLATKEANEEDHRSQMRDLQIQLESTRAELVGTISDKAAKMDQLESAILDLRQSREDLLVEDQQKLDEMTSRVEQLQRDKLQLEDQLKEGLGSKVELQSKFDSLVRDHSSAKESFEREASELRSTVEIVTQERDQASQVVLGLQDTRTKLQSEIDTLIATTKSTKELHQTELAQAKDAVAVAIRENVDKSEVIRALQEQLARLQEEHNALQGAHETCQVDKDSLRHDLAQSILEKETAQRSRQEAQDDLERFQRASMAEETKVVAELREELAKARKAREEDTAKLQADLHGLERAIEEEKQLGASSLREAQKDKDAVLSQHALELERRDQLEKDSYRDAEDLRKLLKAATDEKAAAAGALEAYKREVQASESAIMAELRKELASAQTAREEAMAQLEKAESASTNALQSQGEHQRRVEEQLQASKQELEAERKQSEEMAQAHASEIASLKVLVTEGAAGIDQLQQQLKQSREDGSQLSAQSSKHLSDLERLRNELSTKLAAANEEKETLRQTMEDVKTELQQAQTALETDRSRLAEAAELSDSLRQKLESREQQFITNLQQIQQSVESQKRAHVEAERQLESTKAVLAEVSGSKDEMAGKVAALEIDCAALRGALDRSQTELVESQKTVAESAEKATALAKQVAELQASISVTTTDTRTRQTVSASEPSMRSTVVVETLRTPALTTASTGDGAHSPAAMLRTKENEEIDRLEKVVEAQKIVIEEQREKILYWSRVSGRHIDASGG